MKILFICIGNSFSPFTLYKENYFIKAATEGKNNVLVIASNTNERQEEIVKINNSENMEYTLIRLPYNIVVNKFITQKIRKVDLLFSEIINFSPDVIFYNCPQIYNIKDIRYIKKALPNVKIIFDFSTSYDNSGRTFLSLNILHKVLYKNWLNSVVDYVDSILYVSDESRKFITEVYRLPEKLLVHNSLPGEIIERNKKKKYKEEIMKKYNLTSNNIIFSHTGKMDKLKNSLDLLKIFCNYSNNRFVLILTGKLRDDIKQEAERLIKSDERILYLGFLSGEELTKVLCATDMYLQPGSVSQTAQTAICCGCAITFRNYPIYQNLYNNNGFIIDSPSEIEQILQLISENPKILEEMSNKSYEIAYEKLDYRMLFNKMLLSAKIDKKQILEINYDSE
ncbi:glycosyltransferase [Tissierella creatinini]|nr:glycosyltransferase [Tissierella creatinini]TJX61062.1 glycosyltransferase [Soehngenia saccharolytica]